MKFYVQKNILEEDVNELVDIFKKNQIEYELFYHIPFDNSYPKIDKNKKAFVYAASSVTDKIFNDHQNFSGVFAHTNEIRLSHFFNVSPELMWSEPIYMGKFKNFKLTEAEIFIRPLVDRKWIAGMVMNKNQYDNWIKELKNIDFDFNEAIFVANVNQPQEEYRLFFVNRLFSTGSQYRGNNQRDKNSNIPTSVMQLAEDFIEKNQKYLPKSFVVDVGISHHRIGVIEVNGINNAGFYGIDKEKLIIDLMN